MTTGLYVCAECGAASTAAVEGDLCPACLLRLALCCGEESAPEGWFGPYRVVRLIGQGGMGRVYLAEQREPIWRQAAVKVVKRGMDTERFIARFQSERQALALLEHPGIARIYDAGSTPDGRPYFAMEYVADAMPVTEYCDRWRLTVRQRLELFARICLAVHHAHLHGVIHRDIKPSNVLVTTRDGAPEVKVIDFGVAKAAKSSPGGQAATLYTEEGALIGTPEYMSPEQAVSADALVDARADVYSLGVLLYELMTGVLPYATPLRSLGYFDLMKRIREEDPIGPAQRLKSLRDAAEGVARARGTDARTLARRVRGDLEWIALRAMRKEPERRYASAAALAADVERHLRNEPVTAGPPGAWYRARKFAGKHRLACVATAAVLAVAVVAATLGLALQRRAAAAAESAAEDAYIAAINGAALDLAAGDPDAARSKLDRCDKRFRSWEWEHLIYRADPSLATIRVRGSFGDAAAGSWFGFTPDGLALWTTGTTIDQWRGAGPAHSRQTPGRVLAMNSEGSALAIADGHGGAGVYRVADFRLLSRVDSGGRPVLRAAFDGPARKLAAALDDGRLGVWDARSGRMIRELSATAANALDVRMNREGTLVAASFADGSLRVWGDGMKRGGQLITTKAAPSGRLALMPGFPWLFAAVRDREAPEQDGAALFRPPDDNMLRLYRSHDPIADLAFNPGKSHYALLSITGELQLCDGSAGCTALRRKTSEPANSVAFSPDSLLVYSAHARSGGAEVAVWDAATRGGSYIPAPAGPVLGFAVEPSGRNLVVALRNQVERLSSGRGVVAVWGIDDSAVVAIAAAADGSAYASLNERGAVRIWESDGRPSARQPDVGGAVAAAFDAAGQMLAIATPSAVRLWDRRSGRFRAETAEDGVRALAFRPDGQALAVASGEGVTVRALPTMSAVRRLATGDGARTLCVAWNPLGSKLAAGDSSGIVHVWNAAEGPRDLELRGHAGPVLSVAFYRDGPRVASGSADRTARVWTADTGKAVLTLNGHADAVHTVEWSTDGATLFTGAHDIRLRQTRAGALRDVPELGAGR